MAITPTNSNTISLLNLPQAQLAAASDVLLLQTTNGTQTISFNNLNVVKTDVAGNASVTGNLSGNAGTFTSLAVNSLTAAAFCTSAGPGVSLPAGYYNNFTIQNGLILSASENITSDPVYVQLYSNDIPAYVQGLLKSNGASVVIEKFGNVIIPAGTTSYTIFLDKFFSSAPNNQLGLGNITPAHISLASDFVPTTISVLSASVPATSLTWLSNLSGVTTSIPYAVTPVIQPNSIATTSSSDGTSTALQFVITIGTAQAVDVTVWWRLNVTLPA